MLRATSKLFSHAKQGLSKIQQPVAQEIELLGFTPYYMKRLWAKKIIGGSVLIYGASQIVYSAYMLKNARSERAAQRETKRAILKAVDEKLGDTEYIGTSAKWYSYGLPWVVFAASVFLVVAGEHRFNKNSVKRIVKLGETGLIKIETMPSLVKKSTSIVIDPRVVSTIRQLNSDRNEEWRFKMNNVDKATDALTFRFHTYNDNQLFCDKKELRRVFKPKLMRD